MRNRLRVLVFDVLAPVAAIITLGGTYGQRTRRGIEVARSGARRAAALTQRLLAFSRRQPRDPRPVDVNALIRNLADLIQQLTDQMMSAARELQFELAARLRDEISDLKKELRQMMEATK